jgi:hypothetical protein
MPVTVSDLIHSSMRLIGAIAAGETLETNELNDAFVSLNQMRSSWDTEGASLVGRKQMLVPLTLYINNYPLNTRPVKIEAASVSISNIDCPLEIVDASGWENIAEKLMIAVHIEKLFCDYQYPNSTVWIWPAPRVAGGQLELWIYALLAQFTDVNQTIDLPPGYEAALRYNLAIALLPEYPRSQVDPTLPALAQNYKASIVQLNAGNQMKTQMPALETQAAQANT